MIEKLKLSFCLSSDLGTPQEEEEATRYFGKERRTALETFASGLNLSSDEAGLLAFAKKYLETPDILHPLFEPRAHKELATLAHTRIPRLFEAIDKVTFELTKEGVEPEEAFLLSKRLERLRAEFEIWREAIKSGNFEVFQIRPCEKMPEHFEQFPDFKRIYSPNLHGQFPSRRFSVQWNPEVKRAIREKVLKIIEQYTTDGGPIPPYVDEQIKGRIIGYCFEDEMKYLRQQKDGATPEGIQGDITRNIEKLEAEIKATEQRYYEAEKWPKIQHYIEEQPDGSRERKTREIPNSRAGILAHVRFFNSVRIAFLRSLIDTPARGEPEEFRQIWLNPAEDIPFVLQALKDLEFIDENEVWRWNTKEDNPRGVIEAIHLNSNLFSDFSGEHRARVFGKRFKFPNPEKRFEKKGENYNRAMKKMANYLKNKP
ncbi:MAG TPA: hypothetical protein PLL53_09500 [Saprospiraceae bacterium]|nr:hypothetical protein [Saprospiraceae bacterium]